MTYSEQLEREAEQARARFESTLDELRARFTPGQIVDHFVDYARNGTGSEFLHNLSRRSVENPLPLVLVGTGLAWLMLSKGNGARGAHDDAGRSSAELMESGRSKAGEMLHSARSATSDMAEAASGMAEAAKEKAAKLSDTAGSLGRSVGEHASSAYGSATGGVRRAAETAAHLGHDAADTARSLLSFCREQPLVLAGLGLALGAAIGATFPTTETESRMTNKSEHDIKSDIAKGMSAAANGSHDAESDEGRHAELSGRGLPSGSPPAGSMASAAERPSGSTTAPM